MSAATLACLWLALLSLAAPAWAVDGAAEDCALEWMECAPGPDGYDARLEVTLPAVATGPVEVELVDTDGGVHQRALTGTGRQVLSFTLPAPAANATLDPQGRLGDPDRYNNHWPRKLLVTPWPDAPTDAYLLRYFPGLTFKQGQAPVRPRGAPMMPPAQGPMGLGVGLEGRLRGDHGWQVLANMGASPFAPSLNPLFSLHGYWLPHPNWGLDGDVGFNLAGTFTSEFGTSLILWDGQGPTTSTSVLAHQLRAAIGRQAPVAAGQSPYDYGQMTLFRDDTMTIGLASNATMLVGLDGAWRASMDAQRALAVTDGLWLRLNGSVGTSDPRLPIQNRLGAGLLSQDWMTARSRANTRLSVLTPLARGLSVPMGLSTLAQVEGNLFVEGAHLWGADRPHQEGLQAGVGMELVLLQDTIMGFPLALNIGYAVPVYSGQGLTAPWPGRFYITTTDAVFPRLPAKPPAETP